MLLEGILGTVPVGGRRPDPTYWARIKRFADEDSGDSGGFEPFNVAVGADAALANDARFREGSGREAAGYARGRW